MTNMNRTQGNPVRRGVVTLAAAAALFAGTSAVQAQDVDFKGKTFRVIVGYAPGGGYDIYARTMARYLDKYLPGKPRVIVQNMAGAGSVQAVNYIYSQAPKDGTQFATFSRTLPITAFAGGEAAKGLRFDPLKLTWIGTSSSYQDDAYLMAMRKDRGVTNISDLRKRKDDIKFASTSFGSTGHDVPLVLRDTLGLHIQVVHGYPGGNTLYLAVDRGEMDGRMVGYSSIKSAHREWLDKDSPVKIMLQFARATRHPDLPDVPTARELASREADRDLIELVEAPYFLARPFAAPPNVPAANAKAVRAAFMASHKDPGYVEEARKLRIDVSPLDGERVTRIVERIAKMPRELYDRYAKILENPKSAPRTVNWQIVEGKISKIAKKGRFEFESGGKTMKSRMSNSYTKLKIKGKKAKTKSVKAGMTCKIWWEGNGSYAGQMECN
jgi:tripartite-type tricarboxylate transporter receptor subunit TctC